MGIADAAGPALLHGVVNTAKLKYLLFTGKMIDASEAERLGLVTEVVPDDRLEARVAEIVEEVRATSPESRRLFKEYVNSHHPLPHGGGPALAGAEALEGLRAFAEGRPPTTAGRPSRVEVAG